MSGTAKRWIRKIRHRLNAQRRHGRDHGVSGCLPPDWNVRAGVSECLERAHSSTGRSAIPRWALVQGLERRRAGGRRSDGIVYH